MNAITKNSYVATPQDEQVIKAYRLVALMNNTHEMTRIALTLPEQSQEALITQVKAIRSTLADEGYDLHHERGYANLMSDAWISAGDRKTGILMSNADFEVVSKAMGILQVHAEKLHDASRAITKDADEAIEREGITAKTLEMMLEALSLEHAGRAVSDGASDIFDCMVHDDDLNGTGRFEVAYGSAANTARNIGDEAEESAF